MIALVLVAPLETNSTENYGGELAQIERVSAGVIWVDYNSGENNTCHYVTIVNVGLCSIPPQVTVETAVEFTILSVPLDVLAEVFVAQMVIHFVFY